MISFPFLIHNHNNRALTFSIVLAVDILERDFGDVGNPDDLPDDGEGHPTLTGSQGTPFSARD